MGQKVFAFGGLDHDGIAMKRSEVYDVKKNSWNRLPDMPQAGECITWVRVKNQIILSSNQFRLMSYNIINQAYSCVESPNDAFRRKSRCIASSKEKLYVFEEFSIYEITKQFEVLAPIITDTYIGIC